MEGLLQKSLMAAAALAIAVGAWISGARATDDASVGAQLHADTLQIPSDAPTAPDSVAGNR